MIHTDAEKFWRDGYLILRNVFSADEIATYRQAAKRVLVPTADLLSDPTLTDLLLDDRILSIAKSILGGTPTYFGDSNVSIGPTGSGYHKDNCDRYDRKAPDWSTDRYPLIRFALAHAGGIFTTLVGRMERGAQTSRPGMNPASSAPYWPPGAFM